MALFGARFVDRADLAGVPKGIRTLRKCSAIDPKPDPAHQNRQVDRRGAAEEFTKAQAGDIARDTQIHEQKKVSQIQNVVVYGALGLTDWDSNRNTCEFKTLPW